MIRRLGARYELQEPIGGGGMAVVYRAVDTLLDRIVAVKMLRPQYAGDDEFVARFRQEAQSAARLSHPNIVNLYDIGVSNNEYYLVMEYVDGPTLKDIIRQSAPLEIEDVIDVSMQICDALDHAHQRNIIHRDIKPHNILITKSGLVKVTDFGIARAITGNTITYQQADTVLGSVHYFSPEQARGGVADAKSDIYSLGVVMYEMLTNELPFSGDTPVSVALKHLQETFVEPRRLYPEIPQSLENVVLRCLVKSPEFRYPDLGSVRADLEQALANPDVPKFEPPEDDRIEATISVPAVGAAEGLAGEAESADPAADPPARRRFRWGRVLIGVGVSFVVLIVAAIAAYYIEFHWLQQTRTLTMPNVIGQTEAQATQTLLKDDFLKQNIVVQRAFNNSVGVGRVYHQSPAQSQTVRQTREVVLYVSKGPLRVQMPDLQNYPQDQAVQDLLNLGFAKSQIQVQESYSDQINKGNVVDTSPSAGTTVAIDQPVTVTVSKGPQTVVPMVIGLTLTEAKQLILTENLQIGHVWFVPSPGAQDQTVVNTSPYQPGQPVAPGAVINLYVAANGSAPAATGTSGSGSSSTPSGQAPSAGNSPGSGAATSPSSPGAGTGSTATSPSPGTGTGNATSSGSAPSSSSSTSGSSPGSAASSGLPGVGLPGGVGTSPPAG